MIEDEIIEDVTYVDQFGMELVDRGDHVRFDDRRYHILISSIYDDGEQVGPENIHAVAPTIAKAHAYIAAHFNNENMHTEAIGDDPLRGYRLFFENETPGECNMTIWTRLVQLV